MTVLELLNRIPSGTATPSAEDWFALIGTSLEQMPGDWLAEVEAAGSLTDDEAWRLLSWVETAATELVRQRSSSVLSTAAFALVLTFDSTLDQRDCLVVASLLRRAAGIAGLDFAIAVSDACSRAGKLGQSALLTLLNASPDTPATHIEMGVGSGFQFQRRKPEFDVTDLEHWLLRGNVDPS